MSRNVRVSNGYATYSESGKASTCGVCPVRDGNGVCPIRAEVVPRNRPVCRYGHRKILSQRVKNYNQRKEANQ